MLRIILISAFVALVVAQEYRQPVAILSEQRYLSGNGKFGSAYSQEDGINFKEETDDDGTRHGSYSYIDPTGQRRTISYTAGKNGFQPSGDHLPVPPPAPPQPAPTPGYQPLPQYQPPSNNHYQAPRGNNDYDDGSYDPRYNNPSYGQQPSNYQNYQPPSPPQHQYQPPPQQYQPQPQYQPPQQYQPPTPPPRNFKPPGKLSLNRTPDGFSFSFNKV